MFSFRTCPMTSWWRNHNPMSVPMYFHYHSFMKIMSFTDTTDLKLLNKARNEFYRPFEVDWCITWHIFFKFENFELNMNRIWQWHYRTWPKAENPKKWVWLIRSYRMRNLKKRILSNIEKWKITLITSCFKAAGFF